MATATRLHVSERGRDLRAFTLLAFGGAGPLHGVEVARLLGIPEVIIPPFPGINSAIGLLTTDLKYDMVRTAFLVSERLDLKRMNADLADMEKLVKDPSNDLFAPIPHGQGQTLLREALLVADHNSYHVGQLILLRRLLGAWK